MIMKNYFKPLIIIIAIFMVVVLLVNPHGNFPLNDDWVYGHTVQSLLYDHKLDFYEFTGPILIAQTFYGFIISFFTGFSYNFLRLSTLLFSISAVILLYLILEKNNVDKKINLFACLLFLFNPIFINTSFTFLTDMPFLFFYLFSLWQFSKYFKTLKNINLLSGLLAIVIAFFIRQNGILLLISLILIFLLSHKKVMFQKSFLTAILITTFFCALGYILFKNNINISEGQTHLLEKNLLKNACQWFFYSIQYLGLFSLPLLLIYQKNFFTKKIFFIILIFFIFLLSFNNLLGVNFPYNQNIINNFGLGPNTEVMSGTPPIIFTNTLKIIVNVLASLGGAFLILFFITNYKKILADTFLKFILINFILQLTLILVFISFDRYYLLLLPLIFILIVSTKTEKITNHDFILPITFLLLFAFFSVSLQRNYMDWNRIRSYFYQETIKNKFYYQVDGGYELNGQYTYDIMKKIPILIDLTRPWYINRLFPKNTREYVISFSELPNYKIVTEKEYYNYFLFKKIKLYLLKKIYY